MTWRNRIVGHGEEAPDQLLANPRNWRIHPKAQQEALAGMLGQVGWVQDVIVNRRTGHVVDGHLRVALAISRGEPAVPVVYVDLEEEEERLVLAALDPLAAMAGTDKDVLAVLVGEVRVGDEALAAMLAALADAPGAGGKPDGEHGYNYQEQYAVTVVCTSEADQEETYNRLMGMGYTCRVVVV